MFFGKNECGTSNRLTHNFKKIPFLAFLIVLSALTVLYLVNTFYGFIGLLAFDASAQDALVALPSAISSVIGALIILPLFVCAALSTYSGWKLYLLPNAGAANIANIGMFAKAVKIYESYVYALTAIGVGIVATVFSLFAFVLTGVESVATDIVDTAVKFGLTEDADTIKAMFENEAAEYAITYIISFVGVIVFCVFITRAFAAVSAHFVKLSDAAKDSEENLPKTPIATIILGLVFLAIAAVMEFSAASVFGGLNYILLIAFLVTALYFFMSVKLDKGETKEKKVEAKPVEEKAVEGPAEAVVEEKAEEVAAVEEVASEESVAEEAPVEEPVSEAVATEEPVTEEVVAEEPATEEVAEEAPASEEEKTESVNA